eukprot:5193646-Prymnesium_polylepis.1
MAKVAAGQVTATNNEECDTCMFDDQTLLYHDIWWASPSPTVSTNESSRLTRQPPSPLLEHALRRCRRPTLDGRP